MFAPRIGRPTSKTVILIAGLCLLGTVAAAIAARFPATGALFTNQQPVDASIGAARIFSGERVTPAFAVSDRSAGSAVDASSATAFGSDGRYFLTRAWPTAFAGDRYLDLDFNTPLPAGLDTSSVTAAIRLASDAGSGSVCVYLELRRASTDALLSTHGSGGAPLACTSGTTYSNLSVTLTAVTGTGVANDLRIRIYGRDTAAGAIRLDEGSISGQTPYASWTLYPILTREQFSGQVELIRWSLATE